MNGDLSQTVGFAMNYLNISSLLYFMGREKFFQSSEALMFVIEAFEWATT